MSELVRALGVTLFSPNFISPRHMHGVVYELQRESKSTCNVMFHLMFQATYEMQFKIWALHFLAGISLHTTVDVLV